MKLRTKGCVDHRLPERIQAGSRWSRTTRLSNHAEAVLSTLTILSLDPPDFYQTSFYYHNLHHQRSDNHHFKKQRHA